MTRRVYVSDTPECTEIAITENGRLEQFYRLDAGFMTGNIYVGKIRQVKKHIGVFVDLGEKCDGLLAFREGLKAGDTVLCQVRREAVGDKGCSLTEKIMLPGRYAVLNDVGEYKFSRKISEETKVRLFSIPRRENAGFIFRSMCENADNAVIAAETDLLFAKYEKILSESKNRFKPCCLFRDSGVDVAKRYAESDDEIIFGFDDIADEIKMLGERKINVDGVELVFDKTEAMTVVDVNFHLYDKSFCDVETANFNADAIAVAETARQLRLRNIGGITVVDFISLARAENRKKLNEIFVAELGRDSVAASVELVEGAGLFVVVRKQRYAAL